MNAKDFIRTALDTSKGFAMSLLQDMSSAPVTMPTSKGGNHPLWIVGHIAYSEALLLDQFILGRPNRFEKWKNLFAPGATPIPEADLYPSMNELFAVFEAVRKDTMSHLATISEGDLDKPSRAPEEFGEGFSTVAGCFNAMVIHAAFHAGQVADARRAAGRKPLMM